MISLIALFAFRVWLAMPEPPIRIQPTAPRVLAEPWRRQRRNLPF